MTKLYLMSGVVGVLFFLFVSIDGLCEFPAEWVGQWFQIGLGVKNISRNNIEIKGRCVFNVSKDDKFILKDEEENCHRCIVMHQNHHNVLQYKESYCVTDEEIRSQCEDFTNLCDDFKNLCDEIPGDAQLFSMFRANGEPEPCPFKDPPFQFSYSKGNIAVWCKNPMSSIDLCTDDFRLLFRYQACTDMDGTESSVEELECLASWKDGNQWYLVGKLFHETALTDEQQYRCFAYQHAPQDDDVDYYVAQSPESTCTSGLTAREGSRAMKLYKVDSHIHTCQFPEWISAHRRWHSLDFIQLYHLQHHNSTIYMTGSPLENEKRLVCHKILNSSKHSSTIVTHVTQKCSSGYVCTKFYWRSGHIIEFQQSDIVVQDPDAACLIDDENMNMLPYTTLVTQHLHIHNCPYIGHYIVEAQNINGRRRRHQDSDKEDDDINECLDNDFKSLVVGCPDALNIMKFYSACSEDTVSAYLCHGSWEEDGKGFLIASLENSLEESRFCFIYRKKSSEELGLANKRHNHNEILVLLSITDSCYRHVKPGITGSLAFNLTLKGQCTDIEADKSSSIRYSPVMILFVLLVMHMR